MTTTKADTSMFSAFVLTMMERVNVK